MLKKSIKKFWINNLKFIIKLIKGYYIIKTNDRKEEKVVFPKINY
jgi:hypothetical protein